MHLGTLALVLLAAPFRAHAQAVREFLAWCEDHRVPSIMAVQPVHVAGYIEELTRARSAPTAKQRLSAIRHLFDWLVVGQVMPANPASSVRGHPLNDPTA